MIHPEHAPEWIALLRLGCADKIDELIDLANALEASSDDGLRRAATLLDQVVAELSRSRWLREGG